MRSARAGGEGIWTSPDSGREVQVRDWIMCNHCQWMHHVEPKEDPATLGGFCRTCMGFLCPSCVHKREVLLEGCTPFMEKIEQAEAKDRLRRQIAGTYA